MLNTQSSPKNFQNTINLALGYSHFNLPIYQSKKKERIRDTLQQTHDIKRGHEISMEKILASSEIKESDVLLSRHS